MTDQDLRESFVNASRRERTALTLPPNFDTLGWDGLDFLGWRDAKFPSVGYAVGNADGGPLGIMLRHVDGRTRSRPQCSWCEDVLLPKDVVYFNAKRAGKAGRNGNTASGRTSAILCTGSATTASTAVGWYTQDRDEPYLAWAPDSAAGDAHGKVGSPQEPGSC